MYGLTFALARLDDPFESPSSVANRAYEIAWSEFVRYSGHYVIPDRDEAVTGLEQAWEDVHETLVRAGDSSSAPTVTPELSKAINHMISTGGRVREAA